MKSALQLIFAKSILPLGITAAALLGWWVALPSAPHASTDNSSVPGKPVPALPPDSIVAPATIRPPEPSQRDAVPSKAASVPLPLTSLSLDELRVAWSASTTLTELQAIAQELATRNTADSVQCLMEAIASLDDWSARAELAKHLRAVSDPETLTALLPALLQNYGRGNTILNEIADAVGRMAQPDTVETLAAMHWQASTQAGQGHKILRTVAGIRNPPATRALLRLAERSESPALAAAATEALQRLKDEATP